MDNKELMPSNEPEKVEPQSFEGLPKGMQKVIREFESLSVFMGSAKPNDPSIADNIAKKLQPEHIDKMLDNQQKGMETQRKENIGDRIFWFAIALLVSGLIVTILVLFRDKPEMAEKIIYAAVGALGGFGLSKIKRNK